MRRIWAGLVTVLASGPACHPTTVEAPPTASAPQASVAAEAPTDEDAPPPRVEPYGSVDVPGPPELQQIVPLEAPFADDAVVVRPVFDQPPLVLFADERASIRRRVAAQLDAQGTAVVPMEQLERIEAAAAQGQLVLEGDKTCRAPLTTFDVEARYFPRSMRANSRTMCVDKDCVLQVEIGHDEDDTPAITYMSEPVRRPESPRGWVTFELERVELGYVSGGYGFGSSHSPPILFGAPFFIGPWSDKPPKGPIGERESHVAQCAHPNPQVGFEWEVRAAVAPDRTLSRCTAESKHSLARATDGECLCRGFEALRVPRGKRGRRFRLRAIDDGRFVRGEWRALQLGTEPWVQHIRESPALGACFDAVEIKDFAATAVFTLSADGTVEGAEVFGDITTPQQIAFSRCLVEKLQAIALPCPPPGIDVLQVGLTAGT